MTTPLRISRVRSSKMKSFATSVSDRMKAAGEAMEGTETTRNEIKTKFEGDDDAAANLARSLIENEVIRYERFRSDEGSRRGDGGDRDDAQRDQDQVRGG